MIINNNGKITIDTAEGFLPLLQPLRFKGAKGGRGSGKSHFFAEMLVEELIVDPTISAVCIREVQKSLRFSAKRLIEKKIAEMQVGHLFKILDTEIRRIAPAPVQQPGVIIFQGLQDHTADSIKSLEDFRIVWVEEAQSISARSMQLLLPTFRAGSQLWFSWNPDQPDDPVEKLFATLQPREGMVVHVNYLDNPMCPEETISDAERHRRYDSDTYDHVWLGAFNTKRDAIIFNKKFEVREFEPQWDWDPLHGLDWGFALDPTAAVRAYVYEDTLYIRSEAGKVGLDLDDTPKYLCERIPGLEDYVIRADNARPESISYCKRHGLHRIEAVEKWPGSVEDGIQVMRAFKRIVIHPDCIETAQEFRLYCYKVDKQTGDVLPQIVDKNNHYIDAIRYALAPIIRNFGRDYEAIL